MNAPIKDQIEAREGNLMISHPHKNYISSVKGGGRDIIEMRKKATFNLMMSNGTRGIGNAQSFEKNGDGGGEVHEMV